MFFQKQEPTYKIVRSFTISGMQQTATKLMWDNWKPQGGILKSWGMYYQAFVQK